MLQNTEMGTLQQDAAKSDPGKRWSRRSVNLQLDLLQAYESGDFYDCTMRVGCDLQDPNASYRDFKCHKLILSGCSKVFEAMFLSRFKEATMGPDEPIPLDRINPEVFDSAMRFIYGEMKDFTSVSIAIQVYKFAQEMQITSLVEAGFFVDYLEKNMKASEVFAIFDMYIMSGNQLGMNSCKAVLGLDTKEAINSEEWLKINSDSVLEFLQLECLNVVELDLVEALIKWGKFQLHQEKLNFRDYDNLRRKILFGLKQIRFESIGHKEFAQLCQKELGFALSGDEKCAIFMSIITGDWMATDVAPLKLTPRHSPYTMCDVPFDRDHAKDAKYLNYSGNKSDLLIFTVDKATTFAGLTVNRHADYHQNIRFELRRDWTKIADGTSIAMSKHRGVDFCTATPVCTLEANTQYKLFFYISSPRSCDHKAYSFFKEKSRSDGLTVTIATPTLCIQVSALVFKNTQK